MDIYIIEVEIPNNEVVELTLVLKKIIKDTLRSLGLGLNGLL